MTDTVATQAAEIATREAGTSLPPLETLAGNEAMRHIPRIDWMIEKLDDDLRRRIEKLMSPFIVLRHDDPHYGRLEQQFRALCTAIDRLGEMARHTRNNQHAPHDLAARIGWSINHAVTALRGVDPETFGRRFPFHTGERSQAEPLYAALLVVIRQTTQIAAEVRTIDPDIDERLLDGLVTLENPVDDRMLSPIA